MSMAAETTDEEGVLSTPQFEVDVENDHELIVDLKSIASIPYDPDKDGIRTFRAIRMPKGKCFHVPDVIGKYVMDGEFLQIMAPALVYISTRRRRVNLNFSRLSSTTDKQVTS